MAAAYAALVSVMHTIEQIQHHPRPPISLDKSQVVSLNQVVVFLLEFLEDHNSHVGLEMRISDAAHAAEDLIESHIVSTSSVDLLYQGLEKVIQDMDLIKKEAIQVDRQLRRRKSTPANAVIRSSSSSSSSTRVVGLDDVSYDLMDKLTGGQQPAGRQIIPIAGMGGIGKTTLAKTVYQNQVVVQHFDLLVWATISQEYRMREILLELLQEREQGLMSEGKEEHELGEKLHKRLSGRRYLVVMDDIWDIEVWDQLQLFLPNNKNGSRIMLTTRLSNLAAQLADSSSGIEMDFLDENNSWDLFRKTVFGEENCCPFELQQIGKKIVRNCKGLPLSIVVIGGLLAKNKHEREYWEFIGENLNSIVNSEDDETCLKILHMSYTQLPIYLKPCFLYMGVFPEDSAIRVSMLVNLWVAEGFLKPIVGKSLEIVANDYLKDLIDRNLVAVHQLGSIGNIKFCNIHDLLRDLCLREAQKERSYYVTGQHSSSLARFVNDARRIVVLHRTSKEEVDALKSTSFARSLIWGIPDLVPPLDVKLLRILKTYDKHLPRGVDEYFLEDMFKFVNMRYISFEAYYAAKFVSSFCLPWNLHTINVYNLQSLTAPPDIWNLPQLRHVEFGSGYHLPDPPTSRGQDDIIVLQNLQKLATVINFRCGEETVRRIPNIKKLKLRYEEYVVGGSTEYRLNNLERLLKLETLVCDFSRGGPNDSPQDLTFPDSLKKLSLTIKDSQHWEDVMEKIGSLPLLEKLRLSGGSFDGHNWETIEGQFCSLKYLVVERCRQLEYWTTENTHFPRLERLFLRKLRDLKEIPIDIGEIPTLESIEVIGCSESAVISAKEILAEQQDLGNDSLQVKFT